MRRKIRMRNIHFNQSQGNIKIETRQVYTSAIFLAASWSCIIGPESSFLKRICSLDLSHGTKQLAREATWWWSRSLNVPWQREHIKAILQLKLKEKKLETDNYIELIPLNISSVISSSSPVSIKQAARPFSWRTPSASIWPSIFRTRDRFLSSSLNFCSWMEDIRRG